MGERGKRHVGPTCDRKAPLPQMQVLKGDMAVQIIPLIPGNKGGEQRRCRTEVTCILSCKEWAHSSGKPLRVKQFCQLRNWMSEWQRLMPAAFGRWRCVRVVDTLEHVATTCHSCLPGPQCILSQCVSRKCSDVLLARITNDLSNCTHDAPLLPGDAKEYASQARSRGALAIRPGIDRC